MTTYSIDSNEICEVIGLEFIKSFLQIIELRLEIEGRK